MIFSAVIPAHDEGNILRTAVKSVVRAFEGTHIQLSWASRQPSGLDVIIVLDRADAATKNVAYALADVVDARQKPYGVGVKVLETDFGEPGSARNAGVTASRGRYVAILDADDILGRMFAAKAVQRLVEHSASNEVSKPELVLHPEFLYYFGEKTLIWRQPNHHEYEEYRDALWRQNLWDVTMITTRELLLAHPFVASTVEQGAGYEDWEWSLRTSLSGVRHDTVAGGFCYKRTKKVSRYSKDCFHSTLISTGHVRGLVARGVHAGRRL
jgi:glycosyltransferase involved in cell wall biosynthesis